jgi:hypothetical protein
MTWSDISIHWKSGSLSDVSVGRSLVLNRRHPKLGTTPGSPQGWTLCTN